MNGTLFERNYLRDGDKKIIGPIEYDLDKGILSKAIIKSFLVIAIVGGAACFLIAILGRYL